MKAESSFKFKTICFKVRPVYICFFFPFSYFFEDEEETNEITKSERFAERLKTERFLQRCVSVYINQLSSC